jgi:hypothetical protein
MSAYSNNLWAEELGIDLEELKSEDPASLGQMRLRRDHEHYSAKYWELKDAIEKHNDGLLREALTDYYFALIEAREALPETRTRDTRVKLAPKPKPKIIKAGKYQFTEQQLEIAARAFRKQGR